MLLSLLLALHVLPAQAALVKYTDEKGTVHVVQSEDDIPEKYRKGKKAVESSSKESKFIGKCIAEEENTREYCDCLEREVSKAPPMIAAEVGEFKWVGEQQVATRDWLSRVCAKYRPKAPDGRCILISQAIDNFGGFIMDERLEVRHRGSAESCKLSCEKSFATRNNVVLSARNQFGKEVRRLKGKCEFRNDTVDAKLDRNL